MRKIGISVSVVIVLVASIFVLRPAFLPPFYYDNYNEIRANLEAIPGLEIVDDWQHHDVTLEDCGFTIVVDNSRPVRIDFWGCDPSDTDWRELDGVFIEPKRRDGAASRLPAAYLRKEDLEKIGIKAATMESVLLNLKSVLALAEQNPNGDLRPERGVVVDRLFYGLD